MSFVAIVTMAAHPVPGVAEFAWAEDKLVIDALAKRGMDARLVAWSAPEADFEGASLIVVRTPWDYKERLAEFLAWTHRAPRIAPVWNTPQQIRWNVEKSYLADLEAHGVPTVPGAIVRRGGKRDIAADIAREGEIVIKPLLDAGGRHAMRARHGDEPAAQAHLDSILERGDAFVQPFLRSIGTHGERSLVYFRGRLSHAVRKLPASGEFRTHGIWGGTTAAIEASPEDERLARAAVAAIPGETLLARVDIVTANDGRPVVIELEIMEPYLFLSDAPGSPDRFAEAIASLL